MGFTSSRHAFPFRQVPLRQVESFNGVNVCVSGAGQMDAEEPAQSFKTVPRAMLNKISAELADLIYPGKFTVAATKAMLGRNTPNPDYGLIAEPDLVVALQ